MPLASGRIRHTVVFTPGHLEGSAEEADLLAAAGRPAAIPGVEEFGVLRETSPKNDYRFGISMEFADAAAYAADSEHPQHVRFVQERWLVEVAITTSSRRGPCTPRTRVSSRSEVAEGSRRT